MRKKKIERILVAVPVAHFAEMECVKSIWDLSRPENQPDNVFVDLNYAKGYGVLQARNLISNFAVQNKYDFVLFVDSDIVLPNDILKKLYKHNADIATGWYVNKAKRDETEIFIQTFDKKNIKKVKEDEIKTADLTDIVACGFGCTLVKVDALIKAAKDGIYFNWVKTSAKEVSEDIEFCLRAKAAGLKIVVDPSVRCGHIGSFVI